MLAENELPLLADKLKPFIVPWLPKSSTSGIGGGGGSLSTHDIGGAYHSGTLRSDQAPQFALLDGSRVFTGNIVFSGSQTVDGVDLSVHAADANAHHAQATAGTLISLSGQQVSLANGSAQYQIPVTGATPFTPVYTALSSFAGSGLAFSAGFNVGAGTLITVNTNDVALANGTAQYQVPVTGATPFTPAYTALGAFAGNGLTFGSSFAVGVANTGAAGLSVEADAVRLTSSSSPGAAASVLASDGTGKLTLPLFTATTDVTTPLLTSAGLLAITSGGTSAITIDSAGDQITVKASNRISTENYASQTTGWGIDYAGGADFRYLFTDELHAKSFIADLEQALAGGQIICKSVAVLYSTFRAPAASGVTTLTVRDLPSATGMAVFQNGDMIRVRTFSRASGSLTIADCWGTVTLDTSYGTSGFDSATKTQQYTFTRSAVPNTGAMAAGTDVFPDAIILDYGTSGNGFYEVNAIDGAYGVNSPYAQIARWTGHPATGTVINGRFGKISGLPIGVANEMGIAVGSGFTTSDEYFKASNVGVIQNNVDSTWHVSGVPAIKIDTGYGIDLKLAELETSYITWRDTIGTGTAKASISVFNSTSSGMVLQSNIADATKESVAWIVATNTAAATSSCGLYLRNGLSGAYDSYAQMSSKRFAVGYSKYLYMTEAWSNLAVGNHSEISNDIGTYQALMIAGNKSFDSTNRRVNIYDQAYVSSIVEVGQGRSTGNLSKFTGRNSTTSSISLTATLWSYGAAIGFNAYHANDSISPVASGAWKYLGSQYTGNVTRPGVQFFDGNSGVFAWYYGEAGLANEANVTTWTKVFEAGANGFKVTGNIGFNGTAAIAKPTVTGSRGGNAALASLLTALANYGLIVNSSTA